MADIFLSYKRENQALIEKVFAALVAAKHSVWWDQLIPNGAPWNQTIDRELKNARVVVAFMCKDAVESEQVRNEVLKAVKAKKLVLVRVGEDVEMPTEIYSLQYLDFHDFKGAAGEPCFARLEAKINAALGNAPSMAEREPTANKPRRTRQVAPLPVALPKPASPPFWPPRFSNGFSGIPPEMIRLPSGSIIPQSSAGPSMTVSAFAIGECAVSIAEWRAAEPFCPSIDVADAEGDRPAVNVTWRDAIRYIEFLNTHLEQCSSGYCFRLPTEAEWEYACRAGSQTMYSTGASISPSRANYDARSQKGVTGPTAFRGRTMPVKNFGANEWGLYQMHGNVWEWTASNWSPRPFGVAQDASKKVIRGGSAENGPEYLQSAWRDYSDAKGRHKFLGFRLAMTIDDALSG